MKNIFRKLKTLDKNNLHEINKKFPLLNNNKMETLKSRLLESSS